MKKEHKWRIPSNVTFKYINGCQHLSHTKESITGRVTLKGDFNGAAEFVTNRLFTGVASEMLELTGKDRIVYL